MLITPRNMPALSPVVTTEICDVIHSSLNQIVTNNSQFIVNDTLWFARNRKGGITPCVVNSASYISKTFQQNLAKHTGWQGETEIDNQNFDGYGKIAIEGRAFKLNKSKIVDFLNAFLKETQQPEYLITKYFSIFYGMYITRSAFTLAQIPESLHTYFTEVEASAELRVGIEFETGNIGSSFRALLKLNNLFMKNNIDVGVFITSNDKENGATRIWPTSNRNGSFTELESRNYADNVHLPLMEFGFSPDAFSGDANYLGEKGVLFLPTPTNKFIAHKGRQFSVYLGENNDEIFSFSKE